MSSHRNGLHRPSGLPKAGRSLNCGPCAYSEEPGLPRVTAALAMSLILSCVACSGNDGEAKSTEPPKPPPSVPSPRAPASAAVPRYLAPYTADEREAYGDAVVADERFGRRNSRFLSEGQTTKQASDFYRKYSTDWVSAWSNLGRLADNRVTVTGRATVKWVRPSSIDLGEDGGAVVVLRRCLNESGLVVTQNGEPVAQPQLTRPHV
jgi:hypothetical protein